MGYFWVVKWLKVAFDFYIRSSLHVAVCFVALSLVATYGIYDFENNWRFFAMQFCAILFSYNCIKYCKLFITGETFRYKAYIVIITLVALVLGVFFLLEHVFNIYPFLILLFVISLNYVVPIFGKKSLREIVFLKTPLVALCWVILISSYAYNTNLVELRKSLTDDYLISCCFCPWLYQLTIGHLSIAFGYFFFVMALCIPFEIRDLKYDDVELKTIPQVIGIRKTKWLGILLTVLSSFFFLRFNYGYFDAELLIIHVILCVAIWFSDKFKSDYYASFFVEAIPVLWLMILWLF